MLRISAALSLLLLGSCTSMLPLGAVIAEPQRDWRLIATQADRDRLRDWRTAFVAALKSARDAGFGSAIDREGVLLQPDAALGGEAIPNGNYRCRLIRLGVRSAGDRPFDAGPPLLCRVRQERDLQGFARIGGSQSKMGVIFPGDALRQVFLGTLLLADEDRAMQYGSVAERDIAAFVERIGPGRWRMVLPRPHFESQLQVIELIPS